MGLLNERAGLIGTELLEGQERSDEEERPGRNEPCWCGSGRKYKHCHLRADEQSGL